jgi:DNA-binding response OmpR family regulator
MRILLIEDSEDIVSNICAYFDENSYQLDFAYDGLTGLHLASVNTYDIIILDLSLPSIDGLSLCQRLRGDGMITTPIIMLTARHTVDDKVLDLQVGADDYLVKPFSLRELEARIQALFRRQQHYQVDGVMTCADLTLNIRTLEVIRAGKTLSLSPVLIRILEKLISSSPGVVTKSELEYHIWGDTPPESDALRAHIHALRTAIDKPFDQAMLITVHGIGYRLVAPQ